MPAGTWPGALDASHGQAAAGGSLRETLHAAACFTAISVSFLIYGLLQERLMTVAFGDGDGEPFTSSLFIVFCNRLVTCTTALVVLKFKRESIGPVAPLQSYAVVSLANLVSSTCQYDSLKCGPFSAGTCGRI